MLIGKEKNKCTPLEIQGKDRNEMKLTSTTVIEKIAKITSDTMTIFC